jgi:hypothetical protein
MITAPAYFVLVKVLSRRRGRADSLLGFVKSIIPALTLPCQQIPVETSVWQIMTGKDEFRVLIPGISSSGFNSDTIYKFEVYYKLYS